MGQVMWRIPKRETEQGTRSFDCSYRNYRATSFGLRETSPSRSGNPFEYSTRATSTAALVFEWLSHRWRYGFGRWYSEHGQSCKPRSD
ncbi:unnamed protein product, partial [Nesidiocoris tenuis]